MRRYATYLFDMDGTLIDTRELIYQCFKYTLRKYADTSLPREEIYSHIGIPLHKQLEHYLGSLTSEQLRRIADDHMAYQQSIHSHYLKLFPGVMETLSELRAENKTCGIVTSRRMASLKPYCDELGLTPFFDTMVTPEHTLHHKPHPEPVEQALRALQADASDTIFAGDATYDIESGSAAGVDTAFVDWNHDAADTLKIPPTYTLNSIDELLVSR